MANRDSKTGEYDETYSLDAFIQALKGLGEVGTKRVEHAVGCQYRTAIAKLHELEDRELVTSRRIGNAYLWSLARTTGVGSSGADQESAKRKLSPKSTDDGQEGSGPYDPTNEFE